MAATSPRASAPAPHLIFVHIPKAAGSTLLRILRYRHRSDEVLFLEVAREEEQLRQLRDMESGERARLRVLGGHHPYGLHEYFPEPSVYITAMRDPVERVVSLYRFGLARPWHYLHEHLASGMGLEELVRSGLTTETDNGQTRFLAGHNKDIPYGSCDDSVLERAKEHISKHFAGVAIVGDFDRSLILASRHLGWARAPVYNNVNVNPAPPVKVSESALQAVAEQNALDIELFRWVRDRFQSEWEADREELDRLHRRYLLRKRLYQRTTTGAVGTVVTPVLRRIRGRKRRPRKHAVAASR